MAYSYWFFSAAWLPRSKKAWAICFCRELDSGTVDIGTALVRDGGRWARADRAVRSRRGKPRPIAPRDGPATLHSTLSESPGASTTPGGANRTGGDQVRGWP